MQAMHCYDYSDSPSYSDKTLSRIREANLPSNQPHAIHQVVRIHPTTGEKILYVSPRNTDRILEITPEKSEELLQKLFIYIENPQYIYT